MSRTRLLAGSAAAPAPAPDLLRHPGVDGTPRRSGVHGPVRGVGARRPGRPARATSAAAAAAALAVLLVTSGCSALADGPSVSAGAAAGAPRVVVTTNILGDVVGELVGDQADVVTLMPPGADPHSVEISAREAADLRDADLVVSNGLGLEEGLQQHVDSAAAAGVPVVEAGDLIEPLAYAEGDAEGELDPHFWTDPQRMLDVVDGLERELATQVDGLDADALESATASYRDQLEQLDADLEASFGAIPAERRALVTNHHVFGYLAERYGFRVVGAVLPSGTTLAAPSASDLAGLTDAIEEAGVGTIFADASQPDRLVQVLADEADVEVDVVALHTESLSAPGGGAETYLEMMRSNEQLIATGLSP
ncbi:zinc ABC transporter substrate-binding protein AztC [Frigoribacterium sp. PvP032]|uniref:zinc ABC transporter substrate-binding protein AztC n=1 Tax=Frigoribacterium sp. PvP032 TaxID=2806589 RepID=UPI001AE37B0A|nr:zinc ABC transporter substrate-binding protein AztC [Frigoribacterium sp. PvP032]MBP1189748.1 zinc/manganese transport system substrate-binding protein [Frigoribacterium sp. PvP032]